MKGLQSGETVKGNPIFARTSEDGASAPLSSSHWISVVESPGLYRRKGAATIQSKCATGENSDVLGEAFY
jgi:hypothetical protein